MNVDSSSFSPKNQRPSINETLNYLEDIEPIKHRLIIEHFGETWYGQEPCPRCAGILHIGMIKPHHTYGRCETANCLNWME